MIETKEEKFITYWNKQKLKGKWLFLLRPALWMSIGYSILKEVFDYYIFKAEHYQFQFGRTLFGFAFMFAFGFFLFGRLAWRANEKRYQAIIDRKNVV